VPGLDDKIPVICLGPACENSFLPPAYPPASGLCPSCEHNQIVERTVHKYSEMRKVGYKLKYRQRAGKKAYETKLIKMSRTDPDRFKILIEKVEKRDHQQYRRIMRIVNKQETSLRDNMANQKEKIMKKGGITKQIIEVLNDKMELDQFYTAAEVVAFTDSKFNPNTVSSIVSKAKRAGMIEYDRKSGKRCRINEITYADIQKYHKEKSKVAEKKEIKVDQEICDDVACFYKGEFTIAKIAQYTSLHEETVERIIATDFDVKKYYELVEKDKKRQILRPSLDRSPETEQEMLEYLIDMTRWLVVVHAVETLKQE